MGRMLLGLAAAMAVMAVAAPAGAQVTDGQFVGFPGAKANVGTLGQPPLVSGQVGIGFGSVSGGFDRRHQGNGDGSLGVWVNGGQWAQYNNQSFKSDSYNDWWHDRPDRAYPAWMRNNQNCARQWFAGSTLRC